MLFAQSLLIYRGFVAQGPAGSIIKRIVDEVQDDNFFIIYHIQVPPYLPVSSSLNNTNEYVFTV